MRIVAVETLIRRGSFTRSAEWAAIRSATHRAIRAVVWPPGAGTFAVRPERRANGVTPIKRELMRDLSERGWKLEDPFPIVSLRRPGAVDALLEAGEHRIAFEWETGNISSSHRTLNKLTLGLYRRVISAGILAVPSRAFAHFLTDRVGTYEELEPYLELWRVFPLKHGVLEIVIFEHDTESTTVELIPKETTGRGAKTRYRADSTKSALG